MFMHFQHNGGGSSYRPSAAWKWVLFFISLPMLELFLLLRLGQSLGWVATLWLVLVTGFLGGSLAHRQGFAVWRQIQETFARGQLPGLALMEGLMILLAGFVLITPGVLTDVSGFLLLVPIIRRPLARRILNRFAHSLGTNSPLGKNARPYAPYAEGSEEDVIDVE